MEGIDRIAGTAEEETLPWMEGLSRPLLPDPTESSIRTFAPLDFKVREEEVEEDLDLVEVQNLNTVDGETRRRGLYWKLFTAD